MRSSVRPRRDSGRLLAGGCAQALGLDQSKANGLRAAGRGHGRQHVRGGRRHCRRRPRGMTANAMTAATATVAAAMSRRVGKRRPAETRPAAQRRPSLRPPPRLPAPRRAGLRWRYVLASRRGHRDRGDEVPESCICARVVRDPAIVGHGWTSSSARGGERVVVAMKCASQGGAGGGQAGGDSAARDAQDLRRTVVVEPLHADQHHDCGAGAAAAAGIPSTPARQVIRGIGAVGQVCSGSRSGTRTSRARRGGGLCRCVHDPREQVLKADLPANVSDHGTL